MKELMTRTGISERSAIMGTPLCAVAFTEGGIMLQLSQNLAVFFIVD